MTPIEQKEIKGINLKTLITAIASTVTMVVAFMIGLNKINKSIDDQNFMIQKVVYMNETEVRTIKVRLDILESQILEIKQLKQTQNETK